VSNLVILGVFKYFNFFVDSLERLGHLFGFHAEMPFLNIILPIGISFYTFQAMSYVVDIYRRQLKPADRWVDYAAFVSYFPQLVAGPIERAAHLLPQMMTSRRMRLDLFYDGCYLVLWGLYKKVVVADNLALIANPIFSSPGSYSRIEITASASRLARTMP